MKTRKEKVYSDEQYKLLFENNPQPMWVYDLETLFFLAVNDAAVHHYGYSRNEFLGMTIKDICLPEDIPAFLENVSGVKEGFKAAGIRRYRKKDGSLIYVEITSYSLTFAGKNAELVLANDITERREIEERLKQSEEKYRTLIDNIQDGVFISQDAKMQFVNETFAKITGYTVKEVIGMDINEFIAPENLKMVVDRYHRRQAGENIPREYEVFILQKDRKTRLINMNVGLITYRGRVASMGTVKDITERREAEEKLRLFRNLIDQSNDAIFVSDPETGYILDANHKACSNLGYTLEELLDKRVFDFEAVIPDHFSWIDHVKEVREKGYILQEGQHRRKDRTVFPVEVNVNLIVIGKNSYMVAVVRDITRRKMVEKMLKEKARAELYGFIVSALPVFASGVPSHVRNILVRHFAERFEKNVKPRFEEEMKRPGNKKVEDEREMLDVFMVWLTELFSNLGIQTRTTSKVTKVEIEFLNCPWIGDASGNPIFCFICRTIVIRSFTWNSLRGSAEQRCSIANGSNTCRFDIHMQSGREVII